MFKVRVFAFFSDGTLESLLRFFDQFKQQADVFSISGVVSVTGTLDLETAFAGGGARLGVSASPILMPMAEAAIDVDKPSDLELVQKIIRARQGAT